MLIIDTHTHIYSPDEERYPPSPRLLTLGWVGGPMDKPLRPPGDASVEALREASQANGISGVCAIQTATFYAFDNRYICDSSKANPDWVAGVCTLDPDDPHSPALLAGHVRDFGVRGLRSFPNDAGKGSLDSPGVRVLWKTALDHGVVVTPLISWIDPDRNWYWGRDHLAGLHAMLKEYRELPVVLDHSLSIMAGRPDSEKGLAALLRLAQYENLHPKLSFVPSGSNEGYHCKDMHDVVLKIIREFGSERCLWGSAYPSGLWTPGVTYSEHLRIFTDDLPLKDAERLDVLGETARRLYFPNMAAA